MNEFTECEQYPDGSRARQVCRGEATDISIEKQNIWREKNGLPPIGESVEEWNVKMKSRGLGDTIAKITHYTGIKAAVESVSQALGVPCGCAQRQKELNSVRPYQG